ncbi:DUF1660 family phage protein [Lactococcus lactis]
MGDLGRWIMKLMCKLFGHKWIYFSTIPNELICKRCGAEINRSVLDESENVFGEEKE